MSMLITLALVLGLLGATLVLRKYLLIVTVVGRSMEPTLHNGDRLLAGRRRLDRIRQGDLVVLCAPAVRVAIGGDRWHQPDRGLQIKRVEAVPCAPMPRMVPSKLSRVPAGSLVVLSDNEQMGLDSRHWGPYPVDGHVTVVWRQLTQRRASTARGGK